MQRLIALIIFILTLPLYPILFFLIEHSSPGPFIFRQTRRGKNKKPFIIYKFRTMIENADKLQEKYTEMNELDGPFFKITNDPRHTPIGRFLIKTNLDELPQLINIIKGDMSFVGPRPFPVDEANNIPSKYDERYRVKPGVTGLWVIKGFHQLSFKEWMEADVEYANKKTLLLDILITVKTVLLLLKSIINL